MLAFIDCVWRHTSNTAPVKRTVSICPVVIVLTAVSTRWSVSKDRC